MLGMPVASEVEAYFRTQPGPHKIFTYIPQKESNIPVKQVQPYQEAQLLNLLKCAISEAKNAKNNKEMFWLKLYA